LPKTADVRQEQRDWRSDLGTLVVGI